MKFRNIAAMLMTAVMAFGAASCGGIDDISDQIDVSPETSKVVENTVAIGETNSLDIHLNVSKLSVRLGDKNEVHYRVCEEIVPKISEKDGVLSIKVPENMRINFTGSDSDNYIEVTLTKKKLEDIKVKVSSGSAYFDGLDLEGQIKSSSGSISVKNASNGGDIELIASSGAVLVSDSKFLTIREETSSGSGYAENVTTERLEIITSSGSICAKPSKLCMTELKCSSGSISLDLPCKENDCNFDLRSSSGDIEFNGKSHEKSLRIDNNKNVTAICKVSSGDIEVNTK